MDEPIVIDGVYTLAGRLAEGGMAVVYRASVNLDAFDYVRLYAYTQVSGRTHAERQLQARRLAGSLYTQPLDEATLRAILRAHGIPLPGPTVAVKMAKEDLGSERFEAEWQNLLCLSHPHVIPVYGGGWHQGRQYYAMELLEGVVDARAIARSFPLGEKLQIVIQAALGLAFLHDNGLVHRDVKPENILTTRSADGKLLTRITDLGISKTADGSPAMTRTGQFMGTPQYMAPEQMRSARDVDARADIYSLGASLYSIVVGVAPFREKTSLYEIVATKCRGEMPTPPRQLNPDLPEALGAIIERAMAPQPERRFGSMPEFVANLWACLQTIVPSLAATPPPIGIRAPETPPVGGGPPVSSPAVSPAPPVAASGAGSRQGSPEPGVPAITQPGSMQWSTGFLVPAITQPGQSPFIAGTSATQGRAHRERRTLAIVLASGAALALLAVLGVGAAMGISSVLSPETLLRRWIQGDGDAGLSLFASTRPSIPAVHLMSTKSNSGWMLTFQLKDYDLKELLYRAGPTGAYLSSGHTPALNMQTGLPQPNLAVTLPLSQTKTTVFVRLVRPDDSEEGPYELLFDPFAETIKSAKHLLFLTKENWLAFRDYNGQLLVYFTTLLVYRDAMSEIRYSIDGPNLNRRFPLQMEEVYTSIPRAAQAVYVQVLYRDQSLSEVREFRVPPSEHRIP